MFETSASLIEGWIFQDAYFIQINIKNINNISTNLTSTSHYLTLLIKNLQAKHIMAERNVLLMNVKHPFLVVSTEMFV